MEDYKLGDYAQAEAYQWRAFAVAGQIFTYAENWNHVCLAGILLEQDRLEEASAHYRTSLQSENERTTATATRGLGDVAFARGECAEAKRLYLECLASYEHAGTVWGSPRPTTDWGTWPAARGNSPARAIATAGPSFTRASRCRSSSASSPAPPATSRSRENPNARWSCWRWYGHIPRPSIGPACGGSSRCSPSCPPRSRRPRAPPPSNEASGSTSRRWCESWQPATAPARPKIRAAFPVRESRIFLRNEVPLDVGFHRAARPHVPARRLQFEGAWKRSSGWARWSDLLCFRRHVEGTARRSKRRRRAWGSRPIPASSPSASPGSIAERDRHGRRLDGDRSPQSGTILHVRQAGSRRHQHELGLAADSRADGSARRRGLRPRSPPPPAASRRCSSTVDPSLVSPSGSRPFTGPTVSPFLTAWTRRHSS